MTQQEFSAAGVHDFPTSQARLEVTGNRLNVLFSNGARGWVGVAVGPDGMWRITPESEAHFNCAERGTYRASLTRNVLTLRAMAEPCAERKAVLTGAWSR